MFLVFCLVLCMFLVYFFFVCVFQRGGRYDFSLQQIEDSYRDTLYRLAFCFDSTILSDSELNKPGVLSNWFLYVSIHNAKLGNFPLNEAWYSAVAVFPMVFPKSTGRYHVSQLRARCAQNCGE